MNCNKCGEEVFTTTSQYTKFCKDCGKIILKLDRVNTITLVKNIPPVINNPASINTPNYQQLLEDKQEVLEYVPSTITDNGTKKTLLIGSLIIGIIVIAIIAYISMSNSQKETAATEEATEVTTEVVTDSAAPSAPYVIDEVTQENDIITDIDGNGYRIVKIGNQTWMAENLRTSHYNDGTEIPEISNNTDWGNLNYGAYCYNNCYYNNDITSKLYNWYSVNTGKLAPVGWHVPTNTEWNILINYLGGEYIAGSHMKSTQKSWNSSGSYNGVVTDNSSGFSGSPDEYRPSGDDGFLAMGPSGYWWSSSESNSKYAWNCWLNCQSNNAIRETHKKTDGLSIRCIKD